MVIFAQMKPPVTNLNLDKLITEPKLYNYVVRRESDILKTNFVGVANASRKCSDVFNFRARLASQCCLLFKATAYCFFTTTIVWTKTMTSLRLRANFKLYIFKLKSLQLNRVKFSRKSYPRVGKAFVLNNPLYNLKISDYF